MNITIKNLKVAEFASHETLCFECTVYVDGVRAFIAENQGHGGCNSYHPVKGQTYAIIKEAEAYAATVETEFNFEQLDSLIDGLITAAQYEKEVKRLLAKKTAAFVDGKVWVWKASLSNPKVRPGIMGKYPNAVILNDLPLAEAVALYKRAA